MSGETQRKLLKLLVALAWVDGRVDPEEMEIVEAVLDGFGANKETAQEIRDWAKSPRTLDDVNIDGLTIDDAELVLFQAVLLTYIDGEQTSEEVQLIEQFIAKLGLEKERADTVLTRASARAKMLLPDSGVLE